MSIKAHIPDILVRATDNNSVVEVNGGTVGECLAHLTEQYPALKEVMYTRHGKLAGFIAVIVSGKYCTSRDLSTPVKDNDELKMLMFTGD